MKKQKRNVLYEQGNMIDYLGSIVIIAFIFAMILAYAAYGRTVKQRLLIDNIAKEYVYAMEEYGYIKPTSMSPGDGPSIDDLKSSMADVGVDVIEVVTPDTTLEQVGYGDKVTLHIITEFDNPLYVTFESQATLIEILGFDPKLQYEVKMSATSKW